MLVKNLNYKDSFCLPLVDSIANTQYNLNRCLLEIEVSGEASCWEPGGSFFLTLIFFFIFIFFSLTGLFCMLVGVTEYFPYLIKF